MKKKVLSFKISRQAWGAELWIISEQIVNDHSNQKHLQGELCWNKWQIKKIGNRKIRKYLFKQID